MKFKCTLERQGDGHWQARHESNEWGRLQVSGATREETLEKLRGELRYRLELCPCTGESYQHIDLSVDTTDN